MCKLSKVIVLLQFIASCAFAEWTGSTSEPANMKKIDGCYYSIRQSYQ